MKGNRQVLKVILVSMGVLLTPHLLLSQNNLKKRLLFKADTLVFGPVVAGEKVKLTYNFVVQGDSLLKTRIHQVYTGCSCTATDYNKDSMSYGDQGEVNLVFNSTEWGADTGLLVDKHIYVLFNGGSQVIFFRGRVFSRDSISKVRVDTIKYDFGRIPMRPVVNHNFKLTNHNLNPLIIETIRTSGGPTANWSQSPVAHNESTLVKVQFRPSSIGRFNKTLTVQTNMGVKVLYVTGEVAE